MFDAPEWHYVAIFTETGVFLLWAASGWNFLLVILLGILLLWRIRAHWYGAKGEFARYEAMLAEWEGAEAPPEGD